MAAQFDLIVVGGGPAGLEAAKTAAENGLTVALLERKTHPAKIQRSCAQMFLMNMDSFYEEHMYFSKEKKKWVFPVNNFSVNYSGSYREFYACHFISPNAADRIEIGDYELNQSGSGTAAAVFDKGLLLEGLYEEGKKAGVQFFLERNVTHCSVVSGGVRIQTAEGDRMEGTFCIAADGRTDYRIVVPCEPSSTEEIAVAELEKYLQQISGVEFEVVSDATTGTDAEIIVGFGSRTATLLPELSSKCTRNSLSPSRTPTFSQTLSANPRLRSATVPK